MATAPPVQLSERVHLLPGAVNVVLAHLQALREAGVLRPHVVGHHRLLWGAA